VSEYLVGRRGVGGRWISYIDRRLDGIDLWCMGATTYVMSVRRWNIALMQLTLLQRLHDLRTDVVGRCPRNDPESPECERDGVELILRITSRNNLALSLVPSVLYFMRVCPIIA
jgi:hypothetical protein